VGAIRLLCNGFVKSAVGQQKAKCGYNIGDVVGVLCDCGTGRVWFDVNGVYIGSANFPDYVIGEVLLPLLYVFTPKDKVLTFAYFFCCCCCFFFFLKKKNLA
jgi:hypothetical protein